MQRGVKPDPSTTRGGPGDREETLAAPHSGNANGRKANRGWDFDALEFQSLCTVQHGALINCELGIRTAFGDRFARARYPHEPRSRKERIGLARFQKEYAPLDHQVELLKREGRIGEPRKRGEEATLTLGTC